MGSLSGILLIVCRHVGCRTGTACPYVHAPTEEGNGRGENRFVRPEKKPDDVQHAHSKTAQPRSSQHVVAPSRVVTRPVPKAQAEDPREFQLGQIRRRFSPSEEAQPEATSFTFKMVPSDPDFPFEMESLTCVLLVPSAYPGGNPPTLRIRNKEMQRGFQLNVERGFDEIAAASPSATLLGLMNRLDKDLAGLLSRPMADTIKIYRNTALDKPTTATQKAPEPLDKNLERVIPTYQAPTHSQEQRSTAHAKRQTEIRQLIARLGKLSNFKQAMDGVTFTVPFQAPRKSDVPEALQNRNTLRLVVPELYNLQPCRVEFPGSKDRSVENVERAFEERARANPEQSLMAHINYLSQHIGVLAVAKEKPLPQEDQSLNVLAASEAPKSSSEPVQDNSNDRSHVHFIPRPPEWAYGNNEGSDWSSDEYDSTYDSGDETEEEESAPMQDSNTPSTGLAERGVLLSLPYLELYGIELLELVALSVTVKCDRCKEQTDIERLRNNTKGDHSGMKEESCRKCGNGLAAGRPFEKRQMILYAYDNDRLPYGSHAYELITSRLSGSRWLYSRRYAAKVCSPGAIIPGICSW